MKTKDILSIALAFLAMTAGAQDIAQVTLSWNESRIQDMTVGEFSDAKSTLITYGKTKVELKSFDGSLRWALEVVETIGAWTNVNTIGTITYEVKGEGGNGTLTFLRDTTGAKARLLLVNEAGPEVTEYMLSTFVVQ